MLTTGPWRVGTTYIQKYRGGGYKIRVQLRYRTSSPAKTPNYLGEDADNTDPAKYTTDHADIRTEGKKEEDETNQTGGALPPESLESLLDKAC